MKRRFQISGAFPKCLYRFFTSEEHAKDFVQGRIRLGGQRRYRSVRLGVRADSTEGESLYVCDGLEHSGAFTNSIYVLCCSTIDVDLSAIRTKFGSWVVRIHNPVQLAIDLDYSLNGAGGKLGYKIHGAHIQYTKEFPGRRIDDVFDQVELSLAQKAPAYAEEREFRYCVVDTSWSEPADVLGVDLGPLPYMELI